MVFKIITFIQILKKKMIKIQNPYTLEEILKYGFKDNTLGYEYEIIGRFKTTKLDELGNAPGFDFSNSKKENDKIQNPIL